MALAARLEAILSQPATEAELRRTSEEGDAALRVLRGRLRRSEELLARSSGEAEGTLGEFASELRRKHELEREFRQLSDLLARLDLRARELRMSWLAGSSARRAGISSRP